MFVFSECHKRSTAPEHQNDCYHWIRLMPYARPLLERGIDLLEMKAELEPVLRQHLADHAKSHVRKDSCKNPWNDFDDEQRERMLATDPGTPQYPTMGRRPLCQTRLLSKEEIRTELGEVLPADCWSVFARLQKDLTPTTTFYFGGQHTIGNRESVIPEMLLQYLDDHPDEDVCISLGCQPFCDFYLSVLKDNSYIWVQVDTV